MCGIIGILGNNPVTSQLVEGLKRLEYRGYDSAGVATLVNGRIDRRRAEGKLINLENVLAKDPLAGMVGIGHTRWATHGIPNENNAHPHATDRVAVVHNGIIENYQELRDELRGKGAEFVTETDTEVVALLLTSYLNEGLTPTEAMRKAIGRFHGAFGLAVIFTDHENLMIGARQGSPLALGYGEGEMYLGSDALALAHLTRRISYLEEGDWVVMTRENVTIYDQDNQEVNRPITTSAVDGAMIGKGEFRHFMLKEIYEQPSVIGDTLHQLINPATRSLHLPDLDVDFADLDRLTIVACGTAFLAGMVAKYWFEQLAHLSVEVDIASEFRYRKPVFPKKGAALFISQSGETIDTLAALRHAKQNGQTILSIVNSRESTIDRESDARLYTLAGPEIGVASTKAFTTQLTVLLAMAIHAGRVRNVLSVEQEQALVSAMTEIPELCSDILRLDEEIKKLALPISEAKDALYLGRGTSYPIALEGALKLKEISYIHAEGYAAGEMKHGPIALIDESVPVIVVAPEDELAEKTLSNVQESIARGGRVLLISDQAGCDHMGEKSEWVLTLPKIHPVTAPILYTLPVQLLAYHVAVHKGTDVDQPRNLAKSVTVE